MIKLLYRALLKKAVTHDLDPSLPSLLVLAPRLSDSACVESYHVDHSASNAVLIHYVKRYMAVNPTLQRRDIIQFYKPDDRKMVPIVRAAFREGKDFSRTKNDGRIATEAGFCALRMLNWTTEKAARDFGPAGLTEHGSLPVALRPMPVRRPLQGCFLLAHPLNREYPRAVLYVMGITDKRKGKGETAVPPRRYYKCLLLNPPSAGTKRSEPQADILTLPTKPLRKLKPSRRTAFVLHKECHRKGAHVCPGIFLERRVLPRNPDSSQFRVVRPIKFESKLLRGLVANNHFFPTCCEHPSAVVFTNANKVSLALAPDALWVACMQALGGRYVDLARIPRVDSPEMTNQENGFFPGFVLGDLLLEGEWDHPQWYEANTP
jgi:hypothetical protein